MAREQCVDDLRYHRIVVADNPRENRRVTLLSQAGDKIIAQLVFYPSRAQALFGKVAAAQITQRARNTHERNPHSRKLSTIIRRDADCVFWGESRISARARCRRPFGALALHAAASEELPRNRPRR